MAFSNKQVRALSRNVPGDAIRTRMSSGKELTFIEGWYALAQANRIFGFDGWDRETVETKALQARDQRGTFSAIYSAKVRITVRTADAVVVREGHGTGEAQGSSSGEVQDRALKAAETDATKRALATFGKAFGLALYAGNKHPAPRRASKTAALAQGPAPKPSESPAAPIAVSAAPAPSEEASAEAKSEVRDPPTEPARLVASTRIDKNLLTFPELNRVRDKEHLRYVAAQPCLLCNATPSDPHHVRYAQPRAMARKVGDDFTVPLCRKHHRDLHDSGNEAAWWHDMGIEPLEIARDLWEESSQARAGLLEAEPVRTNPNTTLSDQAV